MELLSVSTTQSLEHDVSARSESPMAPLTSISATMSSDGSSTSGCIGSSPTGSMTPSSSSAASLLRTPAVVSDRLSELELSSVKLSESDISLTKSLFSRSDDTSSVIARVMGVLMDELENRTSAFITQFRRLQQSMMIKALPKKSDLVRDVCICQGSEIDVPPELLAAYQTMRDGALLGVAPEDREATVAGMKRQAKALSHEELRRMVFETRVQMDYANTLLFRQLMEVAPFYEDMVDRIERRRQRWQGRYVESTETIAQLRETQADLETKLKSAEERISQMQSDHDQRETVMSSELSTLKESNDQISSQLDEKSSENQRLQDRVAELESSLSGAKSEIEKLQGSVEEQQSRVKEMSEERSQVQTKLDEASAKIEALSSEISDLNQSVSSLDTEKQALSDSEAALKKQAESTQSELDTVKKECEQMSQQIQLLMEEKEQLVSSMDEKSVRLSEVELGLSDEKAKSERIELDLKGSQQECNQLNNEVGRMREESDLLSKELSKLKEEELALESRVAELESEIESINKEKNHLNERVSQLSLDLDQALKDDSKLKEIEKEKQQLIDELSSMQSKNRILESEHEELVSKLSDVQSEIAEKDAELDYLRGKNKSLTNEVKTKSATLKKIQDKLKEKTSEHLEMSSELEHTVSERSIFEQKTDELQTELIRLQNQLAEVEDQFEEYKMMEGDTVGRTAAEEESRDNFKHFGQELIGHFTELRKEMNQKGFEDRLLAIDPSDMVSILREMSDLRASIEAWMRKRRSKMQAARLELEKAAKQVEKFKPFKVAYKDCYTQLESEIWHQLEKLAKDKRTEGLFQLPSPEELGKQAKRASEMKKIEAQRPASTSAVDMESSSRKSSLVMSSTSLLPGMTRTSQVFKHTGLTTAIVVSIKQLYQLWMDAKTETTDVKLELKSQESQREINHRKFLNAASKMERSRRTRSQLPTREEALASASLTPRRSFDSSLSIRVQRSPPPGKRSSKTATPLSITSPSKSISQYPTDSENDDLSTDSSEDDPHLPSLVKSVSGGLGGATVPVGSQRHSLKTRDIPTSFRGKSMKKKLSTAGLRLITPSASPTGSIASLDSPTTPDDDDGDLVTFWKTTDDGGVMDMKTVLSQSLPVKTVASMAVHSESFVAAAITKDGLICVANLIYDAHDELTGTEWTSQSWRLPFFDRKAAVQSIETPSLLSPALLTSVDSVTVAASTSSITHSAIGKCLTFSHDGRFMVAAGSLDSAEQFGVLFLFDVQTFDDSDEGYSTVNFNTCLETSKLDDFKKSVRSGVGAAARMMDGDDSFAYSVICSVAFYQEYCFAGDGKGYLLLCKFDGERWIHLKLFRMPSSGRVSSLVIHTFGEQTILFAACGSTKYVTAALVQTLIDSADRTGDTSTVVSPRPGASHSIFASAAATESDSDLFYFVERIRSDHEELSKVAAHGPYLITGHRRIHRYRVLLDEDKLDENMERISSDRLIRQQSMVVDMDRTPSHLGKLTEAVYEVDEFDGKESDMELPSSPTLRQIASAPSEKSMSPGISGVIHTRPTHHRRGSVSLVENSPITLTPAPLSKFTPGMDQKKTIEWRLSKYGLLTHCSSTGESLNYLTRIYNGKCYDLKSKYPISAAALVYFEDEDGGDGPGDLSAAGVEFALPLKPDFVLFSTAASKATPGGLPKLKVSKFLPK